MAQHNQENLRTVLTKLAVLGFTKPISQESLSIWSEALSDLRDEQLFDGFDAIKKNGLHGHFNAANFAKACKDASSKRPEYQVVDEPKRLSSGARDGISATEWIRRVKNREVESWQYLPKDEQDDKYNQANSQINDKSGVFQKLIQEHSALKQQVDELELELENTNDENKSEAYSHLLTKQANIESVIG